MNEFQPLPPAAKTIIRLRLGVAYVLVALVLVVFTVVAAMAGEPALAVIAGVAAVAVIAVWWISSTLIYRAYGWMLTAETVELRSGVIVHRHMVLPRTRVQNVTVSAGPVARSLGVTTVIVHSAGAKTPNIAIPDVTNEVGDFVRTSLLPSVRT